MNAVGWLLFAARRCPSVCRQKHYIHVSMVVKTARLVTIGGDTRNVKRRVSELNYLGYREVMMISE